METWRFLERSVGSANGSTALRGLSCPDPDHHPAMKPTLRQKRIQSRLLQWFKKNGRDLPWRKTRNPYAIWVSEIMLQQTQVATVLPYYHKFLKTFPTIRQLAKSDLSKVLKTWEGLGYYSRARNLSRASRILLNHFDGKIPNTMKDLLSLPGIGRSTAGAILSFAFDQEAPILDGNVRRVLSRLLAFSGSPGERKAEQLLWKFSESLIPAGYSNPFNQALMDLGSMICTPKDPQCPKCPLHPFCKGYHSGKPEKYPVKEPKKKIPNIESATAVIKKDGKVLLNQRPPEGFLGGLWEFPNWRIGLKQEAKLRLGLINHIRKEMAVDVKVDEFMGRFNQTYSHFKLTLHVFRCRHLNGAGKGKWVPFKDLPLLPLSRIHRRIAETVIPRLSSIRERN